MEQKQLKSLKDFKIVFYEDSKLRPNLLDGDAKSIAEALVYEFQNKYYGVSRHQLRRLYDEVKQHKKLLDNKLKSWEEIKPLVKMVKAKTAYLVARIKDKEKHQNAKQCYDNLYFFLDKSIMLIDEEQDFASFCLLFEAVYGFYYNLGGASTK
jgi:CRISPR type III-A-associated protein Csm2